MVELFICYREKITFNSLQQLKWNTFDQNNAWKIITNELNNKCVKPKENRGNNYLRYVWKLKYWIINTLRPK